MFEKIYALEIFKGIDKEVVEKIITFCETRNYFVGEKIMEEKANSNGEGYILKKGKIQVSIGGQKVAELHEGDIFGEIALLNEEPRTATVKALTDIEVIVLSLDNLIEMINNDDNTINKTIMTRMEENLERGGDI